MKIGRCKQQTTNHLVRRFEQYLYPLSLPLQHLPALLTRDLDANQNGLGTWSKARDRRYTIRNHRCPLVVRVVLNATTNGSGEGSQSAFDTTDKHLFSANERRILTLTMHIARYPFPLRSDYAVISIGAAVIRHAKLERRKQIPTPRTSGAISLRHCG